MTEITLEDGEFINYVETKTNKSTGRLIRLRMKTTKDKTYDSELSRWPVSNLLTAWDVKLWPTTRALNSKMIPPWYLLTVPG